LYELSLGRFDRKNGARGEMDEKLHQWTIGGGVGKDNLPKTRMGETPTAKKKERQFKLGLSKKEVGGKRVEDC